MSYSRIFVGLMIMFFIGCSENNPVETKLNKTASVEFVNLGVLEIWDYSAEPISFKAPDEFRGHMLLNRSNASFFGSTLFSGDDIQLSGIMTQPDSVFINGSGKKNRISISASFVESRSSFSGDLYLFRVDPSPEKFIGRYHFASRRR